MPDSELATDGALSASMRAELHDSLRASVFSSGLNVSPRRVQQIAAETADTLVRLVGMADASGEITAFGRKLAQIGIGHQSMVALIAALHRGTWASAPAAEIPLSIRVEGPLLLGYMAEREEHLLREQERTRRAWERAREASQPEGGREP
jgi:hypothetical protein